MSVAAGDEEQDAVLSDVEEDDPVSINIQSPAPEDVSIGKVRELLAELDRERKEREAAEKAKSELQVSFNRLKALAHDAIRKRDESSKQRDEALREKEEALKSVERVSSELTEAAKGKDEMLKQLEEMTRSKDSSRSEIETAASMLVSGIEKISGKVSNFKNFMAGGLPRSQKYTGLPAVAYGVIKRTNEIVEELLRQIELTTKSRNETRELMEQRNYEIAIEVSQLEATISGLREEVSRKSLEIEKLEKSIGENDEKLGEWQEKQMALENEELGLRNLISEQDEKLRSMETKMSVQRSLLIEQLNYVTKVHREISNVVKVVDASKYSELSESMFMAKETDAEENIKASLAGMESIYELSQFVVEKTRELIEERNREVRSRNEMVSQLVKEKEQIGSLLRSALSRRTSADLSSKTNELFKVAENGLKAAGIDYKFSNHLGEGKVNKETISVDAEEDEVYALAGALENIIKQSQVEIIELKHSLDDLRAESNALKQQVETQKEELNHWRQRVDELEEKERVANANVEALMLDIAAAEEEITRWKVAAQQEADAGKAVEEDYSRQLSVVRQELEEAKQAVIEAEKKLKFKEETATAAMAARDAAEKSLRLADIRATRLRERTEELTRQLEELDTREPSRSGLSRPRYMCWPWEWLGIDFIGSQRLEQARPQQRTNEMELLSEPLL
ncbi:OLC1v1028459C5 [Oldenlandia corymbosa var. corymbosa]|uniref:OLC1v1028459C5 n=1 Tax=Oldenlandia corymbosa var. corymbosa TaxID=529605 RepID=A0AAV1CCB2_OLDCO|nr:OLC1v1028459C5 [Oldenlandia corymbosa var. corymbosa]